MLGTKFLRNSLALIRWNELQTKKFRESVRGCYVMATPPRSKISAGKMTVYALLFTSSLCFYPIWVLYKFPIYQNVNRNEYVGR